MMIFLLNRYLIYQIRNIKISNLMSKILNRRLLYKPKKDLHSTYIFATKDIYDILNNLNIITLVSMFMVLRKCRNGDYVGKCPICQETSNSNNNFRIHRRTRKFKCYSCGKSGNGVMFLMLSQRIPFDEAVSLVNKLIFNNSKTLTVIGLKKRRYFKSTRQKIKEIVEREIPSNIGEDDDLPF